MSRVVRVLLHVDSLEAGSIVERLAAGLDRKHFCPIVWHAAGELGTSEAVQRIRGLAPDIFHSFSSHQNANDVRAAHDAGVPLIFTARLEGRQRMPRGPALNWEFDRNAMTHMVTAANEEAARAVREVEGIHPEKIALICDGPAMVQDYEGLYIAALNGGPRRHAPAAPKFTGSADSLALDDTTVFVTTIGDAVNFADCIAHLEGQTARCRLEVIDRVAPMSAAFAEMHARCTTPYYVQVDEDMMLYPHALARLRELMGETDASVPLVCAALWDCEVERPIQGVKIYRHEIVRRFPYRDTLSCEMAQLAEMAAAGHHALVLSSREADAVCLGDHGKHYTPQTVFIRWQRLFHKHNELGHLRWLEPWPQRLLDRYIATRDVLALSALLGAIAGIGGRADEDAERDWRETNPAWQRLRHYFPDQLSSS